MILSCEKALDTKYLGVGELEIFICDECHLLFFDMPDKVKHGQLSGHDFIQTINIPR
jgi:hypothetical protein